MNKQMQTTSKKMKTIKCQTEMLEVNINVTDEVSAMEASAHSTQLRKESVNKNHPQLNIKRKQSEKIKTEHNNQELWDGIR